MLYKRIPPLQICLFTPESQWHPRGKRIARGGVPCGGGPGERRGRVLRAGLPPCPLWPREQFPSFPVRFVIPT